MQGASGYAQILLATELTADQRRYAETILEQLNEATRILNDLLDFSKLEAGKLDLERVVFMPLEICISVIEGQRSLAEKKGLSIGLEVIKCPRSLSAIRSASGRSSPILSVMRSNSRSKAGSLSRFDRS
jgi:signal transduction histidine kinase